MVALRRQLEMPALAAPEGTLLLLTYVEMGHWPARRYDGTHREWMYQQFVVLPPAPRPECW